MIESDFDRSLGGEAREEGFYWVCVSNGAVTIGYWDPSHGWAIMGLRRLLGSDVDVMGPRLLYPAEQRGTEP